MSFLTREKLLLSTQRRYTEVDLPDGKVRLQSLTDLERGEYNSEMLHDDGSVDKEAVKSGTAKLLVRMMVDEEGVLLFHKEEWPVIANMDSLVTEKLGDAAREHVGFNRDYEKKS
jgi:hypothetical protein